VVIVRRLELVAELQNVSVVIFRVIAFLVIGFALPVLPLHVHRGLGLSTFVVGLVTGSPFAASLISCVWAGNFADIRGSKRDVVTGLVTAVASGLLYLLSLRFMALPEVSVAILLLGRALLGGAESFIITGAVSWGLALLGQGSAGRVIAWMGMAMFAAFAFEAPIVPRSVRYASLGSLCSAQQSAEDCLPCRSRRRQGCRWHDLDARPFSMRWPVSCTMRLRAKRLASRGRFSTLRFALSRQPTTMAAEGMKGC